MSTKLPVLHTYNQFPPYLLSEQSDSKPLPDNAVTAFLSTAVHKEKAYPRTQYLEI